MQVDLLPVLNTPQAQIFPVGVIRSNLLLHACFEVHCGARSLNRKGPVMKKL
jgi:hypothetical protein